MGGAGIELNEASPRIGEVIEASTTGFVAECYELNGAPAFGSLVRTHDGDVCIYALTAEARTGGIDQGRRPMARGRDELTEDGLYANNPELKELLRSEFSAIAIGFAVGAGSVEGEGWVIRQYLPPRPPRIHGFVYQCSSAEVRAFTGRLDFPPSLLAAGQRGATDELVAAFLRQAGRAHAGDGDGAERPFLVRAGKELAGLFSGDITRLNAILRRLRP